MKKLRWGILGCAQIAINDVIPAIQQSEWGEVAAIASRDEAKAKKAAEALSIPKAYSSYEALLGDSSIDAVYIPLPNHLHREWTIRAAQANKHILCEKPMSLNEREAAQMVEASELNGVKLAEAFMYRYHPRYERIKEIIRSGEIGDLRGLQGRFTFNGASSAGNIRFHADMGGGSLYDVGCYLVSAARLLLEREPEAATVQALFSPDHGNVDMMASGLLEFGQGLNLTFQCGMWADFRNSLEIFGTDGYIEIPNAFLPWSGLDPSFIVSVKGERREEIAASLNTYQLQADQFARSILLDEPLPFSPWDAVANMKVLDGLLQSAREKIRVELK
ncbi:Gfo/Idh/MocA family protein [Ammoniphilus sp. YIM 78166]|uniref:Gfo/Idh/MocA family protein n=1 Tax=Ammoniphilus sp. YIM 78166 TaxID=1644106 RepID=UPI00106F5B93|nr:Gfo/Idh/MocA family oxidoreductase [Ammoniphilus sp. YIM 78166]